MLQLLAASPHPRCGHRLLSVREMPSAKVDGEKEGRRDEESRKKKEMAYRIWLSISHFIFFYPQTKHKHKHKHKDNSIPLNKILDGTLIPQTRTEPSHPPCLPTKHYHIIKLRQFSSSNNICAKVKAFCVLPKK